MKQNVYKMKLELPAPSKKIKARFSISSKSSSVTSISNLDF